MSGFAYLTAAAIITAFSTLLCIVYITNKFKEAKEMPRLMDVDFPCGAGEINKQTYEDYLDMYTRVSSDARLALGMFYQKNKIESLRHKSDPEEFPKRKVY